MARWFESFSLSGLWRRDTIAAASPPPRDPDEGPAIGKDLVEYGASGTPNVSGYITGEDYNPKLDGKLALKVYDEMRRSNGQVQSSLMCCKYPVQSATWSVQAPDDADPQDVAIAEFCHETLFGDERPWNEELKHLLLRVDFGFSFAEIVWRLADDRTIRVEKLAPRMPYTVERWKQDERNNLVAIEQYAWKNDRFELFPIPIYSDTGARVVLLTVHDKEGENHFGRSPLRAAYMHWYYVMEAYRTWATSQYRYGVGVPWAQTDRSVTMQKPELDKLDAALEALRSHHKSFLRTTNAVVLKILRPEGDFNAGFKDSAEHHNTLIARALLTAFMTQGDQKHGSFGLGNRMTDFFSHALESLAGGMAADLTRQVVRQLCDYNFVMKGRRYPKVTTGGVTDVDVKELAEQLNVLHTGKFITPDDEIEDILRKLMKLPPLAEDKRGRDRTAVPAAFGADPTDPNAPPTPAGNKKAPQEEEEEEQRRRKGKRLRLSARYVDDASGLIFSRQPTAFELATFALREVPARLDGDTAALIATMGDIRREQLLKIADQIAQKDARDTGAFTDIRPAVIDLPWIARIESVIKDAQRHAFDYGVEQVRQEANRQGVFFTRTPMTWERALALDATAGAGRQAARSALVTSAKVTAEKVSDAWYARILETALRERRIGKQGADLEAAIVAALQEDAEKSITREAKAEVNEAFAFGRAAEASTRKDDIEIVIYSCLLDAASCGKCEDLDGEEMALGSDRYFETMPPYHDCDGRDLCRCVHLFKFQGAK